MKPDSEDPTDLEAVKRGLLDPAFGWTPEKAAILDQAKALLDQHGLSAWHFWGWCVARDVREDNEDIYADEEGKIDPEVTTGDMLAGAWESDLDEPRDFVMAMYEGASAAHALLEKLYPGQYKPAQG